MAILDSQGRLFGKLSILDVGAALVILLVILGIVFVPGNSGTSIAQQAVGGQVLEVDVQVIGFSAKNAKEIVKPGDKTNFIIRNQPYGQVEIKAVEFLGRTVTVTQPDGSVKALPDPRPEQGFSSNMILTLTGKGQVTANGPVLGNSTVKAGIPVEMDGKNYNTKGTIIEVRVSG
jgi:hypothetical protein